MMAEAALRIVGQLIRECEASHALSKDQCHEIGFQAAYAIDARHFEADHMVHDEMDGTSYNERYSARYVRSKLSPDMRSAMRKLTGDYAAYRLGYHADAITRDTIIADIDALERACSGLERKEGEPDPFMSLLHESLGEVDGRIAAVRRVESDFGRAMAL